MHVNDHRLPIKLQHLCGTLLVCVLLTSSSDAGVFLTKSDYDAQVGSSVTPNYASLAAIDFPLGTTDFYGFFNITTSGGASTPSSAADFNSAKNFVFDFDPTNLSMVEFVFAEPVSGVSGFWSNTFVQDGFRVSTPFNDYDLNQITTTDQTFIGITEPTPFSSVKFTTSNNIPGDDFVFFRDFNFAVAPVTNAVPEPSTLLIYGYGCLLPIFLSRRRKK